MSAAISSLTDIFKSVFSQRIGDVPQGVFGCQHCRNSTPWREYAIECPHHKNKHESRQWNEARRKRKHGYL